MDFLMFSQRARRRLLTLVAAALLIGVAFPVLAESDQAETLIRQALELRRMGDDQKAYRLLHEAHELSRSPRSAAQLGFCAQALGSWVEAEVYMEEALRVPGDPWIGKNRSAIERALMGIKSHIARVEVTGEPAGAEVLVNGIAVGKLPLAEMLPVAAGEIEIELRAPGYASLTKKLRVEGGQTHRIRLRAEKARDGNADKAKAARPFGVAGSPRSTPDLVGPPPSDTETSAGTPSSAGESWAPEIAQVGAPDSHPASAGAGRRSLKFVSWGVAAVGVGAGAYGVFRNSELVDDFDSGCGIDAGGVPHPTMGASAAFTDARCSSLKHDYENASILGIVGLVGGGVFAVAGLVLWLTEPSREEAQTAEWTCAPALFGRDRAQLTCAVRF